MGRGAGEHVATVGGVPQPHELQAGGIGQVPGRAAARDRAVAEQAEERDSMEFGEWEVDDDIWEKEAKDGDVQDSLPMRRARKARAAAILTQEGQEDGMVESLEGTKEGESGSPSVDEILLLVDATNGFNMLSRLSMLWTVRHRCSKIARHEIRLVCRRRGKSALVILSRTGVTQGNPLAMAL